MKIATVSDDGISISQHFGKAPLYVVLTVENGKVVSKEERVRGAGNTCACNHDSQADCHESHGSDASSQAKHASMAASIDDCQVIIARGMGWGAYASLRNANLAPVITDVADIDEAVKLYLDGELVNLMERLH